MKEYDSNYIIRNNNDIQNALEAAFNHEGGLVLLTIDGCELTFSNVNFAENIDISITKSSEKILFNGCSFECYDKTYSNDATRVVFNECRFAGSGTFIKSGGYQIFNKCLFECDGEENAIVSESSDNSVLEDLDYTIIKDSIINQKSNNSVTFINDGDSSVTVINLESNNSGEILWTKYMVNENTFSYYNTSCITGVNEGGYEIDNAELYNDYNIISGEDGWNPLNSEKIFREPQPFYIKLTRQKKIVAGEENSRVEMMYYPANSTIDYSLSCVGPLEAMEGEKYGNKIYFSLDAENDSDDEEYGFITVSTHNGVKSECVVTIEPSLVEPPKFLSTPVIVFENGVAKLKYELDLQGREDESDISWYRMDNVDRTKLVTIREFVRSNEKDCRKIAVSRQHPCKELRLTSHDIGKHIKVNIKPKHSRSTPGAGLNIISRIVMHSDVTTEDVVIEVDKQVINPYYYNEPGYGTATGLWHYSKLPESRKYGLITASDVCGFYYDSDIKHDNMTVFTILDFEIPDGEGFNNKGDCIDIFIKFDGVTKCGYGLRCECVNKENNLAGLTLYKFDGLSAQPISSMNTGRYLKSGLEIKLDIHKNIFSAEVFIPEIKHTINMSVGVEGNQYSGMGIRHRAVAVKDARVSILRIEMGYPL